MLFFGEVFRTRIFNTVDHHVIPLLIISILSSLFLLLSLTFIMHSPGGGSSTTSVYLVFRFQGLAFIAFGTGFVFTSCDTMISAARESSVLGHESCHSPFSIFSIKLKFFLYWHGNVLEKDNYEINKIIEIQWKNKPDSFALIMFSGILVFNPSLYSTQYF